MKFGEQPGGVLTGQAWIVAQIFPKFRERNIGAARAAQHLGVAEFQLNQDLLGRLGEFREGQLVGDNQGHQPAFVPGLREQLHIPKSPDFVGIGTPLGPQLSLLTAGQGPDDMRIDHLGGGGIVFTELPDPVRPWIGKAAAFKNQFGFRIHALFAVSCEDFLRPGRAAWHGDFIDEKINSAGRETDAKIGQAQSPKADACRPQGGELVVS